MRSVDVVVIGAGRAAQAAVVAAERRGARVAAVERARFVSRDEVDVAVRGSAFVVCTGSVPRVPSLRGLDQTSFSTRVPSPVPASLVIIGGGAHGLVEACAATNVVVLEAGEGLLPAWDAECVAALRLRLEARGIRIHTGVTVESVRSTSDGVAVSASRSGDRLDVVGAALLVAVGRRPNVDDLGLENAGVEYDERGIRVDRELRTTNPRVFAFGEVAGRLDSSIDLDAEIVVRNALLPLAWRVDDRVTPVVIATVPQLSAVGLTVAAARDLAGVALFEARAEDAFCRLVTLSGRLVGAHLVAANAGEMIQAAAVAIRRRSSLARISRELPAWATLIAKAARR